MPDTINEPVSVNLIFDHNKRKSLVSRIIWRKRIYKITQQGLRHTYTKGSTLYHVFDVSSDTISFRIVFDSSSLNWNLEKVYDQNFK